MTSPSSDVDMPVLAEQARTILAGGRCALLTLPCAHVRGWVGLIDDGGEPLLLVGADSPPARCADSGRRARVDVPGHNGERLVLAGVLASAAETADELVQRLGNLGRSITVTSGDISDLRVLSVAVDEVLICLPGRAEAPAGADRAPVADRTVADRTAAGSVPVATELAAGTEAAHAELAAGTELATGTEAAGADLAAGTEVVEAPAPRRSRVTRRARGARRDAAARPGGRWSSLGPARRVELTSYALAEPDLVTAYAPDLIEHLNKAHAAQMRQLAARGVTAAGSICADEVIGASVTSLDRAGLDMWRIGPDGADAVRVLFRSPLAEPRSLGLELRLLLEEAEHGTE
ncbi:DUF2470 domain-containing protein [Parafrankia soli]|uniref:DUF2470 domain-containing protein n=1 Tax=Parafrankia soli TaxID=2599596 RepID=A0A1S1Q4X8_9ACTN|nr:DUF2470 domain-containing protein [Parafrankia soli]OHV27204.1 DUF2470 domain-containing protein [Parafrankia soli]